MDLLDFEVDTLYFDQEENKQVETLIQQASEDYSSGAAELPLLQAYFLEPESLNVLIALNRFYYYQHKLDAALVASTRAFHIIRAQLDFPQDWRQVQVTDIGALSTNKMSTLRMYLFALKSIGFLNMRLDNLETAKAIFKKLVDLDAEDRIGSKGLLELVNETQSCSGEYVS